MICVSPSELKIIIAIFKKHILKGEVRAFGSRYKWQCKDYSDLDIAIDIGRTMTSEELEAVEDDFIESDLPYRVDVLDYNGISAEFRAVIDKGCEVVYKANGWKKCILSDILTFQRGHDLSRDNMIKGIFPVVGSNGIIGYHSEYTTNAPCVTIGRSGNVGNPHISYIPSWAHNTTLYVKKYKNSDPVFVYYLLKTLRLSNFAGGSAVPTLNRNHIHNLPICVPPLPIQRTIAAMLSCLDDKIELNNRINKTLEEMAQAIFKSWFVDFEPFLDGEFEDSELGKIPKGWRVGTLLDIADYLNGLAMQRFRPLAGEDGLTVLKIKELRQGVCDSSSDLCSPTIRSDYIVRDGDVIFSWSGSLVLDFWCGGECGLNQHLFKVTSTKYDKWFYYSWTCHHLARFIAMAADKATTMGHIKREALENAKVIVPINDDYRVLNKLMTPLYEKIINNRVENRRLATIRGTLLPKLMSGELLT